MASDMRVVVQKRSSKSPAFPDMMAFPGGVVHPADETRDWLPLLPSTFAFDRCPLHPITRDGADLTAKHVSTRITAIRETFEESGILLCKKRNVSPTDNQPYASYLTDFDVLAWQKEVNHDPKNFLKLCQHLDCYPDIRSIYLWSNWLTPVKAKQTPRFNTLFYIAAVRDKLEIYADEKEVASMNWSSPRELLKAYSKDEIALMFPQWYEFTRLTIPKNLDEFVAYAQKRNLLSCSLFYPSRQPSTDGVCMLLPGDQFYPREPDFIAGNKIFDGTKSFRELRSMANALHRAEGVGEKIKDFVMENFTLPHCQLSISDQRLPNIPDNV